MRLADVLKDPLGRRCLGTGASVATLLVSIPVNAWFQRESYIGLAGWVMRTVGDGLTEESVHRLTESQAGMTFSLASRLPYGLLMTVFALLFLVPACRLGHRRTWGEAFRRACTALLVPILLLAVSALCMRASFAAGIVCAMLAVSACVSTLVLEARRNGWNGWLVIAWVAGFLLITVVMLTRNHVVTMFG